MKRLFRISFVVAIFAGGLIAGCQIDDWLDIDTCLDRGGAWDYTLENCRFQ